MEGGSCENSGLQCCPAAERWQGHISHSADLLLKKQTAGGAMCTLRRLSHKGVLMAIFPTWECAGPFPESSGWPVMVPIPPGLICIPLRVGMQAPDMIVCPFITAGGSCTFLAGG